MNYNSFHYLITNYHVVSKGTKRIEIETWDKIIIPLILNNRYVKFLEKPKDITVIRLEPKEIKNIQYLDYDLNYIRGYNQYLNSDEISIGYPKADKLSVGSGKIKKIESCEFYHNSATDRGSSGSPIILFHSLNVVGIHKQVHKLKMLNYGTFIFEIFKEIKEDEKNKKEGKIIAPTFNKKEEIKKYYNIINDESNNCEMENEINCIYDRYSQDNYIVLFHDFQKDYSYDKEKNQLYNEAKKNINE